MKLFRMQSMYTMTPMYHMYMDSHMKKFKRVMRHIKLISMNRRLFWMHLKVNKVDQGAVHVHHDPHVPYLQGQAHAEVQEGHEAHQIDQNEQEVVLDAVEGHEVDQGAVHVHHKPHVPHVQGQAHEEVQEGHETHAIDQHEQEVVLNALKSE
jgi:hypothetical protein